MSLLAVRWHASVAGIVMCMTLLGGCASTGNPRDPFEPLNRGIYHFNDGVDTSTSRPTRSPTSIRAATGTSCGAHVS